MTQDTMEAWERFRDILKLYGEALTLLNPSCSAKQIEKVEKNLSFELPSTLKTLLTLNNGQQTGGKGVENGIFKGVSGWDVYKRHIFLSVDEIETAYKTFIKDKVLLTEFGSSEIPFAISGSPWQYGEAFCINKMSNDVSLIWVEYIDFFSPAEWQVQKFVRAASLSNFIEKQIELYR